MEVPQQSKAVENTQKCYHCGLPCDLEDIEHEGRHFCCQGCQTVYSILSRNDLSDYYQIVDNPGNNLRNQADEQKFAFLDNSSIQEKLLTFQSENFSKVQFFVPSIHCSSCIWLLENLEQLVPGVIRSSVNFSQKEVTIDFDPAETSLREIVSLMTAVGYEPQISLEQLNRKEKSRSQQDLLIKIGIAGFCFGNIMLLSFPEYLGFISSVNNEFQDLFTWIMLVLSLPVLFYCSIDYFRSSLYSIAQRQVNIDVPIAIGIITLFSRSAYEIITQTGPGYLDSFSGLIFFLLIGKWFQSKTYEGLSYDRDYRSYFPLAVTRIRDGRQEDVISTELQPGDRIFIRNKELIPADCILISDRANIDYSFVTGESTPQEKNSGDEIYAGGRQVGPAIEMDVIKEVSGSYLSRLWDNETFRKSVPETQQLVDRISYWFTPVILFIALIAGGYWLFTDIGVAANVFTAVLIVACPCALALSTPFALGSALRLFGRKSLYLKNTPVIEKMTRISHVVFDKTGTITDSTKTKIRYQGESLNADQIVMIATVLSNSTHPLSRSLFDHLKTPTEESVADFDEAEGLGLSGVVNGQLVKLGSSRFVRKEKGDDQQTSVHISVNDHYKGKFIFENHYRSGLREMVHRLKNRYGISILTGDNESEKHNLKSILPGETGIYFNQSPYDKLDHIKALQANGKQVLMVGDGLNDAGALRQSDIGIAVTDDITAFTPASDGILLGKMLDQLDRFLGFSHTSRKVVISSFIISFLYNATGLFFAVTGQLTPLFAAVLMPLSSITVVIFTTSSVNLLSRNKFKSTQK